jgi:putative SOS response-associated peptidase YedK
MCGRYSLATPDPRQLRARFGIAETVEIPRRYNVAPSDDVLALTADSDGAQRTEMLRWGLVPDWAKEPTPAARMINARAETITEKPAYRQAFERFRCLIPADGFFEWRRQDGGPKQAFHITRADGEPFAFAGLWSAWHRDDADQIRSCTIITTAANDLVAPLHDRMPAILDPEAESIWLDRDAPPELLLELLHGLSSPEMHVRAVGPAVNNVRNDGPECLADPEPSLF